MASDFYRELFAAQEEVPPELICQYVLQKVTQVMQGTLERAFTVEEGEVALFQMGPSKGRVLMDLLLVFPEASGSCEG
jgi:hypothetical protein